MIGKKAMSKVAAGEVDDDVSSIRDHDVYLSRAGSDQDAQWSKIETEDEHVEMEPRIKVDLL